jgi:hypothetical protein
VSGAASLQGVVVGLAVAVSAFYALGIFAPRLRARLQRAAGGWLSRDGRPRWLQAVGRWMIPPASAAAGCGGGCSSCDSCGSAAPPPQQGAQPLQFVDRRAEADKAKSDAGASAASGAASESAEADGGTRAQRHR